MPESTPQVNPTEIPNTPKQPAPIPDLTQPGSGYVSTDASVQAKIKAMQQQALQLSSQAPKPAPGSPGTEGPASPGSPSTGYGTEPGANRTDTSRLDYAGPTPGAGSVYQEYTGEQRLADTLEQLRRSNPGVSDEELLARRERALISQRGDVPLIPNPQRPGSAFTGAVYDPTTNSYRDPNNRYFYSGFDPTLGHIFTPEQRIEVENMPRAGDSGVITTDQFRSGISALDNAINYAQFSPLPAAGSLIGGEGDPVMDSLPDELKPIQEEIDKTESYKDNPSDDPLFKLLDEHMRRAEERQNDLLADIHAQAQAAYEDQKELNKQAEGRVKVAMANLGIIGSSQDLQFTADTIRQGQRALNSIADSERRAILEARVAFEEMDFQTAFKKVEIAETRRKEFLDLNMNMFQMKQAYEQNLMNKQIFRREVAEKDFALAASSGAEWSDLSPEQQTMWTQEFRTTPKVMEEYFNITRNIKQAEQTKSTLEAQKLHFEIMTSGIEAAEGLTPDQSLDIPMPDGSILTVHGSKTAGADWKTSIMSLGPGEYGPAGQYMVTHDAAGNPVNIQFIGDSYVTPHFNDDTNKWNVFNPSDMTTTDVFNEGEYFEGVAGMNTASSYVDILDNSYTITQEPGGGYSHKNLTGWDFSMPVGTDVRAPDINGRVIAMGFEERTFSENPGGMSAYGNYVDVQDMDTGVIFRFGHLSDFNVTDGSLVSGGDIIGLSGNTGFSTGPHLHFEILNSDGSHVTPNRNAPGASKPVTQQELQVPPQTPSFVKPTDIQSFQRDTGMTYNPESKSSREAFAGWKKEKRDRLFDEAEKNRDIALRRADQLENNPVVRDYRELQVKAANMSVARESMERKLEEGKGIGPEGMAIIIGFNKMLDPGSVVREGEYDRATFTDTRLDTAWEKAKNWVARGGVGVAPDELRAYVDLGLAFSENALDQGFLPLVQNEVERARIGKYDPRFVIGNPDLAPIAIAQGPDGNYYEVTPDDEFYLQAFFTGEIDFLP